jgi:hypothetical protein
MMSKKNSIRSEQRSDGSCFEFFETEIGDRLSVAISETCANSSECKHARTHAHIAFARTLTAALLLAANKISRCLQHFASISTTTTTTTTPSFFLFYHHIEKCTPNTTSHKQAARHILLLALFWLAPRQLLYAFSTVWRARERDLLFFSNQGALPPNLLLAASDQSLLGYL